MIDRVEMSTVVLTDEKKKIAKSNNLDWDRYVREIEELKTNPPRMFEVTVPYFTWYPQAEFPAWHANSLIATGVSKNNIPPIYDKRIVVTEPYLKILQTEVPSYLKDIVEIDPRTEEPLVPKENVDNATTRNSHSQQTVSASEANTNPSAAATTSKISETTSPTKQSQLPQPPSFSHSRRLSTAPPPAGNQPVPRLQESESFDFTKLTPDLQETALRLAEQLLNAALQRLSGAAQTDAQLSTIFERTT